MIIPQQDWASKWAVYAPDKIAFKEWETNRQVTYEELNRLGNRLAHYLKDAYDIEKGQRIALIAENCLEYLFFFVAAQKMGAILVPLNYRLASAEIDFLLKDSNPGLIVVEKKFETKVNSRYAFLALERIQALCGKAQQPTDKPFLVTPVHEDDPIFILYTSGTTGFPKGALYTHKMLFWNSVNTSISLMVNTESKTINCMPPFHTGGWNVLVTPFFHHGGYTVLMKKFDATGVLNLVESEDITIFMGVPTMLKMIVKDPGFAQSDLSSLFYIIVGGEPMPIPLIEKWHEKGVYIRQGYGMTEVGPNLTSLHQNDAIRKKGSIGRPNFYVQTRIIGPNNKRLPPNEPGELLLKGPMVTPGYWKNPTATASAIKDGWFHTGDMVLQDEDGYLFVVDRIKNMFISGGENVYPAEVERVLINCPQVEEVAVVGVPDEKWGEVGRAFVVLRAHSKATREDLLKFCASRIAKFKIPKSIVLVEALPKTDTGKIDRKVLKKWLN